MSNEADLWDWIMSLRWPHSEPIKTQRELDRFYNLSLVSVIYYGDNKKEKAYKDFYHSIPHYSQSHQRYGHTFAWDLKKKYGGKLPCIEVKSHVHENPDHGLVCSDLTPAKIRSTIESFLPPSHQSFHHGLSKHWFSGENRHAMVFAHKGIKTDEDKHKHRIFHQFYNKHSFEHRIAELNVSRVNVIYQETRIKAGRDLQNRCGQRCSRGIYSAKEFD